MIKKEKFNVKFLNLIMDMKQNITRLVSNRKCTELSLAFYKLFDISPKLFKDIVDKYVEYISLNEDKIKQTDFSTNGRQSSN